MDTPDIPEALSAFLEAQQAGIRPAGPRPDVPIGPVLTGHKLIPMRDPQLGVAAVCIRFSTPVGPLHFIYPVDAVRTMAKELEEVAGIAELLPDPPGMVVPGWGGPRLVLPGNN